MLLNKEAEVLSPSPMPGAGCSEAGECWELLGVLDVPMALALGKCPALLWFGARHVQMLEVNAGTGADSVR